MEAPEYGKYLGTFVCLFFVGLFLLIWLQNLFKRCNSLFPRFPTKSYLLPDCRLGSENAANAQQQLPEVRPQVVFTDDKCAICLGVMQHPLQACCGHEFCAECIVAFWRTINFKCIDCPLCKRPITMLFEYFSRLVDLEL